MRLLVIAPEPVDAGHLRSAVGEEVRGAQVRVISPALNESPLAFWVSDSDEAIEVAERAQRETVSRLEQEGVAAAGDTGESEPLLALEDALATFDADQIVVFVHPDQERRYLERDIAGEARRRFGRPVSQHVLR